MSAAECPEDMAQLVVIADLRRKLAKLEARVKQLEAELNAALGRVSSLEVQLATAHKCHAMTTDWWSGDVAEGMLYREGVEALMSRKAPIEPVPPARHEGPPPED